ncbi:MAG: transcription antitermination factor NusB [Ruminococcaceae bacterium]|mgnify:CR=1 FL=1|nr:transcription antitermination factor NusB [Oscillospiraceae bacterium]
MNRSQEREQAFVLVYEKAFNPETEVEDIFTMAVESEFMQPSKFTEKLATQTVKNIEFIDKKITEFASGWSLNRITKVSLSILRIAVCEIFFFEDIPVGVSINEAVEIAKKYASKEDSQFINGILGTISRNM